MKTSRPADSKSVPGFKNWLRFAWVIEQNKISDSFDKYCMYVGVLYIMLVCQDEDNLRLTGDFSGSKHRWIGQCVPHHGSRWSFS